MNFISQQQHEERSISLPPPFFFLTFLPLCRAHAQSLVAITTVINKEERERGKPMYTFTSPWTETAPMQVAYASTVWL